MDATRAARPPTKPVTVLLCLSAPDGTVKFVSQLATGAAEGTRYRYFSWKAALLGKYDVIHVHWPHTLIGSRSPFVRLCKRILLRLLLLRIRVTRQAVVRTEHNLQPHEPMRPIEALLIDQLDRCTTLVICLNRAAIRRPDISVVIPHGHYLNCYKLPSSPRSQHGRLLFFGNIRPYKCVDRLLAVFEGIDDRELTLRLVGKPLDSGWRRLVESACARDPRITSRLGFVPDDVLAAEVCSAELVVLPIKDMFNSGTVLMALSLNRPVLVPRTRANELLSDEVGPGWVHLYEGALSAKAVMDAVRAVRTTPALAKPRLQDRDWTVIGQRHYEAYVRAIADAERRRHAR